MIKCNLSQLVIKGVFHFFFFCKKSWNLFELRFVHSSLLLLRALVRSRIAFFSSLRREVSIVACINTLSVLLSINKLYFYFNKTNKKGQRFTRMCGKYDMRVPTGQLTWRQHATTLFLPTAKSLSSCLGCRWWPLYDPRIWPVQGKSKCYVPCLFQKRMILPVFPVLLLMEKGFAECVSAVL